VARRRRRYDPDFCRRVRELGKKGYCVTDAAKELGVSPTSVWRWEQTKPEFRKAFAGVRRNSDMFKARRFERLLEKSEEQLLEALRRVREKRHLEQEKFRARFGTV
jgi:predicted transcriptional regulator